MKLKPQNTYKHLLNFMGNESRPILQKFHFTNGGVEVTNSHILLRLHDVAPSDFDFVLNPKTLQIEESTYPDVDRLIPTKFKFSIDLNAEAIEKIFNFAKSLPKETIVQMTVDADLMTLSSLTGTELKLTIENGEYFTTHFKVGNLKIAFDFVKDNTASVQVGFVSEFRPLLLSVHGQFDLLITPVRMG